MPSSPSPAPDVPAVDALVVGAGPAGSSTAILLARAGCNVTLVDRAAFPRDKACSEYMSPEAVRVLHRLGVLSELERMGGRPLEGTVVNAAMGARLHGRFALAGFHPYRTTGLSVSRWILDHALFQAARRARVQVLERHAAEELLYDGGAIAGAVLRDGEGRRRVLRARLTIGADGLRSVVARRMGARHHGWLRRVAFVAHVDGVTDMRNSAEMFVSRQGYVGLNPIGGGRTNVALVVPADSVQEARGRPEAFFWESLGRFPEVARRIGRGSLSRRVMTTGPFSAWSGRVVADGGALVGDAADFFDPFTGEGIFSALRGAELLAEVAVTALDEPGIISAQRLSGYRRSRRRAFAGKWAVERLIGYGMLFPRLFDRAVARLGRRGRMAHTLIGVTGDFVPAREVLNPWFLARMVL